MAFKFVRRIDAICHLDGVGRLVEAFLVDAQGFSVACREGRYRIWLRSRHRRRLLVELWFRSLCQFTSPRSWLDEGGHDDHGIDAWPLQYTFPTYLNEQHERAVMRLALHLDVVAPPQQDNDDKDAATSTLESSLFSTWYQQWPLANVVDFGCH